MTREEERLTTSIRFEAEMLARIEAYAQKQREANPGFTVTLSDAIRSLCDKGLKAAAG